MDRRSRISSWGKNIVPMSDEISRCNNINRLAILTVAIILAFTAGMIWYNLFPQIANFKANQLYSK